MHTEQFVLHADITQELDLQWEIHLQVDKIYNELASNTASIFKMSREDGLSYKEIAQRKNISVKTVEAHVSKAIKAFRKGLKEFYTLL